MSKTHQNLASNDNQDSNSKPGVDYQNNKSTTNEEKIAYAREYYRKNKNRIALRRKEYREKNKESIAKYAKTYREKHKNAIANPTEASPASKDIKIAMKKYIKIKFVRDFNLLTKIFLTH